MACASPINDVYRDASVQNVAPTTYYSGGYLGCSWVITDKAEDKDIASLLTAIDYFYSDEGSLLFNHGISDEIMASANGDEDWYQGYVDLGLPNGAYTLGADGIPVTDPSLVYDNENRGEAALAYSTVQSDYGTAVAQWLPQYIMGTYDVTDDAAWQNFCDEVDALDWQSSQAALQAVVDSAR